MYIIKLKIVDDGINSYFEHVACVGYGLGCEAL